MKLVVYVYKNNIPRATLSEIDIMSLKCRNKDFPEWFHEWKNNIVIRVGR